MFLFFSTNFFFDENFHQLLGVTFAPQQQVVRLDPLEDHLRGHVALGEGHGLKKGSSVNDVTHVLTFCNKFIFGLKSLFQFKVSKYFNVL